MSDITITASVTDATGTKAMVTLGGVITTTQGTPPPPSGTGWSTFTPTFTTTQLLQQGSGYSGTGTRFVYVSSSTGNDSNTGTQASPKASINGASGGKSLLRSGNPDWLLLKKGDSWTADKVNPPNVGGPGQVTNADGSYSGVILITSYPCPFLGDNTKGARPVLNFSGGFGGTPAFIGLDTAMVGLEFYCFDRDPANGSFSSGQEGSTIIGAFIGGNGTANTWHLVEDCKWSFFSTDIFAGALTSGTTASGTLILNRNQFIGAYSTVEGDQNTLSWLFQNPILTGNYSDQGGWNPQLGIPTDNFSQVRNRNMYIQSNPNATAFTDPVNAGGEGNGPATVSGNITILSVAEGAQMRSGGTCYNNFGAFNAFDMEIGHVESGHPSVFTVSNTYNVFVNPTDWAGIFGHGISTQQGGYGLVVSNNWANGCVHQFNIMAHGYSGGTYGTGTGIQFQAGATGQGGNGVVVNNNIIYNFATSLGGTGSQTGSANTTTPNTIELNNSNTLGFQAAITQTDVLGYYYTTVLGKSGAAVPSGLSYISTGVQGFRNAWWGTLGSTSLTGQCKDNWNPLLTAPAINDWYRTVTNNIFPAQGGY
jgi:hypothetical protein